MAHPHDWSHWRDCCQALLVSRTTLFNVQLRSVLRPVLGRLDVLGAYTPSFMRTGDDRVSRGAESVLMLLQADHQNLSFVAVPGGNCYSKTPEEERHGVRVQRQKCKAARHLIVEDIRSLRLAAGPKVSSRLHQKPARLYWVFLQ